MNDIADELRVALPANSAAADDEDNSELVAELSAAGLLDQPQLIELLLRRADEEQISVAVKTRSGRPLSSSRWMPSGAASAHSTVIDVAPRAVSSPQQCTSEPPVASIGSSTRAMSRCRASGRLGMRWASPSAGS